MFSTIRAITFANAVPVSRCSDADSGGKTRIAQSSGFTVKKPFKSLMRENSCGKSKHPVAKCAADTNATKFEQMQVTESYAVTWIRLRGTALGGYI